MKDQNEGDQNDKENPLSKSIKDLVIGDASSPKVTFTNGFTAVFNGLGIGLLLGILLGLSVSPVVSGVIATISSLLAVLVGLNERLLDPLKSLRIGSFGLFAVIGILLGLYLRANDPFAPTLLDKMEEYRSIGYSDVEAREMITGFIRADSGKVIRQASVLYSGTIEANDCDYLKFADSNTPVKETIYTFKSAGRFWEDLAVEIDTTLSGKNKSEALLAVRDSFCSTIQIDFEKTKKAYINLMGNNSTLGEVETKLNTGDEPLRVLVSQLQKRVTDAERIKVYQALLKIFKS
jgi:hypothetical protein